MPSSLLWSRSTVREEGSRLSCGAETRFAKRKIDYLSIYCDEVYQRCHGTYEETSATIYQDSERKSLFKRQNHHEPSETARRGRNVWVSRRRRYSRDSDSCPRTRDCTGSQAVRQKHISGQTTKHVWRSVEWAHNKNLMNMHSARAYCEVKSCCRRHHDGSTERKKGSSASLKKYCMSGHGAG